MGWDHSETFEDVRSFLARELEIDTDELIRREIEAKLAARGLTYQVLTTKIEGEWLWEDRKAVKFSDGRVFYQVQTVRERSDDWGHDHYAFVQTETTHDLKIVDHSYDYPQDEIGTFTRNESMYVLPVDLSRFEPVHE